MQVMTGVAKGTRMRLSSQSRWTRPMIDGDRAALLAEVGNLAGKRVLDLYAGSGAFGLEALSAGATVTFVDSSAGILKDLRRNIKGLGVDGHYEIIEASIQSVLSHAAAKRYDVIFIDPPSSTPLRLVTQDLEDVVVAGFLAHDGQLVLRRTFKDSRLAPLGLRVCWERTFSHSHITIFAHPERQS